MSGQVSPSLSLVAPISWIGRQALSVCHYLGCLAGMVEEAGRSLVSRRESETPLIQAVAHELSWLFLLGMPLVALVHVGLGSFLSMQSYFGGTFVDGTGAVVGVGLIRNVAPLMACLTLSGLLAARITPELRLLRRSNEPLSTDGGGLLQRLVAGKSLVPAPPAEGMRIERAVAARLIAATVAGPILALWGAAVGMLVGWQVGQSLLGVSTHSFYLMFWDLLWFRDVVGLFIKGLAFGLASGLFACHEGLRGSADAGLPATSTAACRAACLAAAAILVMNSGWFILVYHAGPAFGPTLLTPPSS
jgi:phospholipid/cholesterol/gamma-HCH transport system permease protein